MTVWPERHAGFAALAAEIGFVPGPVSAAVADLDAFIAEIAAAP